MKQYVGKGYTIYKHTNKVNGKSYIGQTKCEDLTRRWTGGHGYAATPYFSRAIKKYGWNTFTHEILETGIASQDEANAKERFYIALYRSNEKKYGYNVQSGGQYTGELSKEGRQRLHERFYGANSPRAKAIDVYTLDGKFLKTFSTGKEAAQYLGCSIGYLSGKCSMKSGTVKNHIVHFHETTHGMEQLPKEKIFFVNEQRAHLKPVTQYDLKGNFIQTFESVKEAADKTGVKHTEISTCINHPDRISTGGYVWREGKHIGNIPPSKFANKQEGEHLYSIPVIREDVKTGEKKRYPSRKMAAIDNNTTSATIIRWLDRDTPIHGYRWTNEIA